MSLATLKAKETKGKQKLLPKLKTILANPIRKRSPSLNDDELESLRNILQSSIDRSDVKPSEFATNNRICLGLESSLRCINNAQSSCVFISLSIKPIHIVSLIARNAEVKDKTQPVYAQPRLEEFTEKLFGIRALCMVLPKDLKEISDELRQWVEHRRKPKVSKEANKEITKRAKRKKPSKCLEEQAEHEIETNTNKIPENEVKSWSGDFISFTEDNVGISKLHLKEDRDEALNALTQIMDKIPNAPKTIAESPTMEVDDAPITNSKNEVDSDDSDDFLSGYKPLIVHKIKANPNRKPKKKRNKNKNKNVKK